MTKTQPCWTIFLLERSSGMCQMMRRLLLLACLVALVAITVGITGYSISWTAQSLAGISSAAAAWLPAASSGDGGDSSMDASAGDVEHPASFLLGIAGDREAGSSAGAQSAGSASAVADEAAVAGQRRDGLQAAARSVGTNGSGSSAGHTSSADGDSIANVNREEDSKGTSTGSDSNTNHATDDGDRGTNSGSTTANVPDLPPADLSHLPPEIAARCAGTAGNWCGKYLMQKPIPGKVGCTASREVATL